MNAWIKQGAKTLLGAGGLVALSYYPLVGTFCRPQFPHLKMESGSQEASSLILELFSGADFPHWALRALAGLERSVFCLCSQSVSPTQPRGHQMTLFPNPMAHIWC